MYSLLNEQVDLEKGSYVFMIDPIWNESAEHNEDYKEVLVDVYAPENVDLEPVDDQMGMMFLASALKDAANKKAPEESRSHHLEEDPDYGTAVERIQDVTCLDCWYGFIVTVNNSKYELREVLLPQLEGLEVAYPPSSSDDGTVNLELPPKSDHIIILRRNSP